MRTKPKRRGLTGPQRDLLARAIAQHGTMLGPYRVTLHTERRTAAALVSRGLAEPLGPRGQLVPTRAALAALERKQGRPVADRARAPGETAPGPTGGPKRTLRLGAHLDAATVAVARRRGATVSATVRDAVRAGLPTLDTDAWTLDTDAPTLDTDASRDGQGPGSSMADRAWMSADHFHGCESCGDSVPCSTPGGECNDYPGVCWYCIYQLEGMVPGD